MHRALRNSRLLALFLSGAFAAVGSLGAQQQPLLPENYIRPAPITAVEQAPYMRGEQLSTARTFRATFGEDDELLSGLAEFAEKNHIASARITGLGGFITATLGWRDPPKGASRKSPSTKSASWLRSSAIFPCAMANPTCIPTRS